MLITGVWLTTRSNYKKNHLFSNHGVGVTQKLNRFLIR